MRIVIDLQGAQSGSQNFGIGRYSRCLAETIVRNQGEHEVIIALSGLFPDKIEPIRADFAGILPQENICVWQAPGPVRYLESPNNWRRKAAELIREAFLASLHPDIVLVTSFFEGLIDDAVTSLGLWTQTMPTAVTLHDLIPLIHRTLYLEDPVSESWYENKIGQIRRADLLLAVSESSRQEAIEHLGFPPDRVFNTSEAAAPQFHCTDISAAMERSVRNRYGLSEQIVMYTGGVDHRKNIEGLIRAYALLSKSLRENHQLAIVCSANPERRRVLEALAKQQGLAENEVILTGFVPDDDLVALYHLCKVFVFPSWHEGFGLPALEAMSCGAAVIGANTSSVPEVIGREDALFDPYDDQAIAEKLTQVLTDSDYRVALSHHGLEQAKKFSWDESAKRAIQAMEQFQAAKENSPQIFSLPRHRPKLAYVSPLPPKRMRIVIDLQGGQCSSRDRGIGRYSLSLAKAIVRNQGEHEVIIALNGLFPDTIEPIRVAFDDLLPQENICVWQAPGPVRYLEPANKWRRKAVELIREAFLASLQPDIVLVTSLFEGLIDDGVTSLGLLAQTISTAVIFYDLIPLIFRTLYLEDPVPESWYESKIDHLRRADLLLSISESTRQEGIKLLGFPPDRVFNASTAADPQFICTDIIGATERSMRNRYGLSQPFVMYTGGIDYRKNIEGLIRAYALLPKSLRENHQLAIVCSANPDARRLLEALAKQQGLAENEVILTGFVPDDDLVALYHLCKVFVFPSWHEGFGLPALEAMSCGAAVIGANTSSVPEVIGREDALFDPYDDQAIAEKLTQVLTDSDYRVALSHHGLEQAKKFSWDESAKGAIQAMEQFHVARESSPQIFSLPRHRPKLAYISPLPPERSGIADYSAELLPELARHYEIEVIVAQETISDPWIQANCEVRGVNWFAGHGHLYERVLYHLGNSSCHQHMFELLTRVPGVVVLHDFFLGHIMAHMDEQGANNIWAHTLYQSHGYRAVKDRFHANNIWDVAWKYPCNRSVLENAKGVIVHSEYSRRLAEQWLGETFAQDWSVIPLLRIPTISAERAKARQALGLAKDAFIVCSFGVLGQAKQNRRLLDAWIASPLSTDESCFLVFVGENEAGDYGEAMTATIFNSGLSDRISITGWMDTTQFRQYLAAADVAVQLRTSSRGETSSAVLDCMNYGLPTIVNAHGSMAELPDDAVWVLPDEFDEADLSKALETLWKDGKKRYTLGKRAREVILTQHAPRTCADQYAWAIERYYKQALTLRPKDCLVEAIAKIERDPADEGEWPALAKAIAQNHPLSTEKQLMLDISVLVQVDAKSGIQRVVRNVLSELLANPPRGFRVEPVYSSQDGRGYCYARQFTLRFLGCPEQALEDEPIEAFNGDIFLGLDLATIAVVQQADFFRLLRRTGIRVYFLIHDLLPILMPHAFDKDIVQQYIRWLKTVAESDGMVCVSQAVANELIEWLTVLGPKRLRPFSIGWSHNGANFAGSMSSKGLPADTDHILSICSRRPTFLMVGTIEPRKGQAQTLVAFELLWDQGVDVNLVIVGKQGWKVETLIDKLRNHPERHRRLFWLAGISDEYLEKVYAASICLIAASEGEGFGLPLIEAAQHKLPIIARDIPVFHEVAREHAFYFSGAIPRDLADGVQAWLALYKASQAPRSDNMPWLTWQQSTQNLLDVILGGNWYQQWMPDDVHRFWGGDSRLHSKVGKRLGRDIVSAGQAGLLIYGPHIPLDAGQYQVVIRGSLGEDGAAAARVDVAIDQGRRILAESALSQPDENDCLLSLPISLDAPCADLEVRVWVDGQSEVTISMVEIQPHTYEH